MVPVTAGPKDEKTARAAGRDHLRASHADRQQVIGTLKAAFVQGRLAKDELDERVGQAFASRTYGELAAVTADLPGGLADIRPQPARARGQARAPLSGRVLAVATVLYAATWPVVFLLPRDSEGEPRGALALVAFAALVYMIVLVSAGGDMLDSWQVKRAGRRPPPQPGQGGRALQGEQDSGPRLRPDPLPSPQEYPCPPPAWAERHPAVFSARSMTHWTWHQPTGVLPICWPMVTGCQHSGQTDVLRALMTRSALMAGPRAGRRQGGDQKLGD
jgi:hypothetical protein